MSAWASTGRYTASDLHDRTRSLHRPRVVLLNVAWICVAAALALSLIGAMAIATTEPVYAKRHLMHLAVGLGGAAFVAAPHFRWARDYSPLIMAAILALLIFVLIRWVPESIVRPRNGARRWINLVVTDFQPSELAKIAYVLVLASYLRFRKSYRRLHGLLIPLALTFVPMGLILVEPDLGTALLFLPTLFAMLVAAGAKLKHLALIVFLGLVSAPLLYPALQPHQKARIRAMVAQVAADTSYDQDIGYQGAKARTLVGAGQVVGVGRDRAAHLVHSNRLPENHNDMIFAVIALRWGTLGAIATWGLFGLLCTGGLLVAGASKDPFGRLVAVGLVTLIFAQMVINTGMTIGLLPITGMTLPFVSSGGTSLVTGWLMVGLLLNIGLRRAPYMTREAFDFDAPGETG